MLQRVLLHIADVDMNNNQGFDTWPVHTAHFSAPNVHQATYHQPCTNTRVRGPEHRFLGACTVVGTCVPVHHKSNQWHLRAGDI
jgi:hypothetical protein